MQSVRQQAASSARRRQLEVPHFNVARWAPYVEQLAPLTGAFAHVSAQLRVEHQASEGGSQKVRTFGWHDQTLHTIAHRVRYTPHSRGNDRYAKRKCLHNGDRIPLEAGRHDKYVRTGQKTESIGAEAKKDDAV